MDIHITDIIKGDVYGHPLLKCASTGCPTWTVLYSQISGDDIRVGSYYEIDNDGRILDEILD